MEFKKRLSAFYLKCCRNEFLLQILYVYDATLGIHPTDGGEATLTNILMGRKTVGDIYLRRYKTSDIPKDDEGAQNFLMDVYKEKDELLGHYKETGGQKFTEQEIGVIEVMAFLTNMALVPSIF